MSRITNVRSAVMAWAIFSGWLTTVDAATAMAGRSSREAIAAQLVQAALTQEVSGSDVQRNELLAAALEQVPNFAPAWWQRGYVQRNHQWLKLEDAADMAAKDGRLAGYRTIREKYPETVEGQFALAQWCARHKLVDQQRAHLTKVLELDPNQSEARRLLGYRLVDGTWRSDQEIADADHRAGLAAVSLREWTPRITTIRNGLTQGGLMAHTAALARLRAIDDPAAIGAIESLLAAQNEPLALLAIEYFDRMAGTDAALALARQAVCSPSHIVREAAAQALRHKDVHSYVPAMLAAISGPIQSRVELFTAPNRRPIYRHVFFREGQEQNFLVVFDTEYRNTNTVGGPLERLRPGDARWQNAATRAARLEASKQWQNAAIEELNQRIAETLHVATGTMVGSTPEAWWQWWNDYNEVRMVGEKPTTGVYQRETLGFTTLTAGGRSSYECLVAGTPVWTETGPITVEQLRVGDRVLAQDPTTGELAYKPVLRTTVRPPEPLLRIRVGAEPVGCSGGHPFWVCGKGWTKARELKPGVRIHTVRGTAMVDAADNDGYEPTYNLVVADFHTYFLGASLILTHDNTIREPTVTLVPGLPR